MQNPGAYWHGPVLREPTCVGPAHTQTRQEQQHRGMLDDSSNNNVVNGLDFDDPPDCNLDDEAWCPIRQHHLNLDVGVAEDADSNAHRRLPGQQGLGTLGGLDGNSIHDDAIRTHQHLDQLIAAGWKTINLQAPNISFIDASTEAHGVTTTVSMVKRALSSEMNDKEIKISRYKCRDSHLNRSLHFNCSHTARPPGAAAA